jgi:hypothetical protein
VMWYDTNIPASHTASTFTSLFLSHLYRHFLINSPIFIESIVTLCSQVLLEKPIATQLVKRLSTSPGTQRFITTFTRAHHYISLTPILILSSILHPGLPSAFLLSFWFLDQNFVFSSHFPLFEVFYSLLQLPPSKITIFSALCSKTPLITFFPQYDRFKVHNHTQQQVKL